MTTPLSLLDAHLINSVLTFGYVLPLYLTKYTRLSFSKTPEDENDGSPPKGASERWRDDPAVIKARLLSVFFSTMISLLLMHRVVAACQTKALDVSRPSSRAFVIHMLCSQHEWGTTAVQLGLSFRGLNFPAYFVTPALFLGPLYGQYISRDLPFMARCAFNKDTFNWVGIRNYIVVSASLTIPDELSHHAGPTQGPISEEVVWRSCLISTYRLAGASNTFIIFFTPVSFGCGGPFLISEQ
jgi:prenyl protein peptidase